MSEMNETISTGNGHSQHRKARTPIPAGESREAKFVRLATQRMSKLKATARHVGNLATYPHTEAQRDKIMSELRRVVQEIDAAFAPKTRDDQFKF